VSGEIYDVCSLMCLILSADAGVTPALSAASFLSVLRSPPCVDELSLVCNHADIGAWCSPLDAVCELESAR